MKFTLDMQMMETHWGALVCGFYHQVTLWLSILILLSKASGLQAFRGRKGVIPRGPHQMSKWVAKAGFSSRRISGPLQAVGGRTGNDMTFTIPRFSK
jgi:hypothetical protein